MNAFLLYFCCHLVVVVSIGPLLNKRKTLSFKNNCQYKTDDDGDEDGDGEVMMLVWALMIVGFLAVDIHCQGVSFTTAI